MLFGKRKKNLEISRDCWNLNYSFITWLNERLPVYKEEAGKHIDLSYHNFTYKGERCSFAQLIDRMIELVSELTREDKYFDYTEDTENKVNELLDIFKLIFGYLWW